MYNKSEINSIEMQKNVVTFWTYKNMKTGQL